MSSQGHIARLSMIHPQLNLGESLIHKATEFKYLKDSSNDPGDPLHGGADLKLHIKLELVCSQWLS